MPCELEYNISQSCMARCLVGVLFIRWGRCLAAMLPDGGKLHTGMPEAYVRITQDKIHYIRLFRQLGGRHRARQRLL